MLEDRHAATAASRTQPWLTSGRMRTRANGGPTEVPILPQFDNDRVEA